MRRFRKKISFFSRILNFRWKEVSVHIGHVAHPTRIRIECHSPLAKNRKSGMRTYASRIVPANIYAIVSAIGNVSTTISYVICTRIARVQKMRIMNCTIAVSFSLCEI
ncbi:unnamed protein product [Anisakis simplex]|uniref:Uncharacterized protein n=1 Tax=Anisakis simplex TaxID=6269 RepID=A0A3P6NYX0_ANISI|nr:unnamed protein product [Anisakis simplex]